MVLLDNEERVKKKLKTANYDKCKDESTTKVTQMILNSKME